VYGKVDLRRVRWHYGALRVPKRYLNETSAVIVIKPCFIGMIDKRAVFRVYFLECLQHTLADVWVVKESELGSSENHVHCRTHLGHLLAPGDIVLGLEIQLAFRDSLSIVCLKLNRMLN
jgi:hypothetical protein